MNAQKDDFIKSRTVNKNEMKLKLTKNTIWSDINTQILKRLATLHLKRSTTSKRQQSKTNGKQRQKPINNHRQIY